MRLDLGDERRQWLTLAAAASAIAAPAAERLVAAAWRLATDEEPPADPAGPDVDWGRAIAWTAASAVAIALLQLAARRGAALGWRRVTGRRPPKPRRRGARVRARG
jgi:hypothetical protein